MPEPSKRFQGWEGMGTGWAVISTLVAGILVVGGLGFLADRLLGTGKILTGVGVVVGGACGVYLVYLHYGRGDGGDR